MATTNVQTGAGRKVEGALDWFGNTLGEFGSADDPDPVDDLAAVLDGDRETAALLWARFTDLPSAAQVYMQTISGEQTLREWLESIIIVGSRRSRRSTGIKATTVRITGSKFCTCCGKALAPESEAVSRYGGSELFAPDCYETGMRGVAYAS